MEIYNMLLNYENFFLKKNTIEKLKEIKQPIKKIIGDYKKKLINFYLLIGYNYNNIIIYKVKNKLILNFIILELKNEKIISSYKTYNLFSQNELIDFTNFFEK